MIAVRGQLKSSVYEDDNKEKKYSTEVMVDKVVFLTNKKEDKAPEEIN